VASGNTADLAAQLNQRPDAALQHGRYTLLVAPNGEKLAGNLLLWPPEPPPMDGRVHRAWIDEDVFPKGLYEDEPHLPVVAQVLPDGSRVMLAGRVAQIEGLRDLSEYLRDALSTAVLLSLLLGITLSRAILRRMDTISRTASEIMAGDLSQRVPVGTRNDEFDALARRLNAMLERIQQLFRGIREVSDNVAHDLRSPLTRLRNRFEVALLEPRSADEYRQVIAHGIEESDALMRTFNALLGIAQAEAGQRRAAWQTVDLHALAGDVVELYAPLAEDRKQTLHLDGGRAEILGSRDLLAQALGNLLDNAIKYTPPGGAVKVHVSARDDAVELAVADTGPGIPEAERTHVLERFVRLESARHLPGNGLGLALVNAVARLHGATLALGDAAPGLRIHLRFVRGFDAEMLAATG
jgi:signal transduction histidine kinase